MSETTTSKDDKKKPLKLNRPGRLELRKTVETGQVRQSFSHGRSKTVMVVVKRKRTFAPGEGGRMTEVTVEAASQESAQPTPAELAEAAFSALEAEPAANLTDAERAARLQALNDERGRHKLEALDYGLGLHVGDVMFGNIGVPERLEFSVIGPAANEVARIESLTKTLGRRTLASAEFARSVPRYWESTGEHALKGVSTAVEVMALKT